MGLPTPRKIRKIGKTRSKKEKKRKNLERESSFLNGNTFLSVPIATNFRQLTSLPMRVLLDLGSTGNFISDVMAIVVKLKNTLDVDFQDLTLADGS